MTKDCIKAVNKLNEIEEFADLTVEQLLYAAIVAVGLDEVVAVLSTTNWSKWCPNTKFKGKIKGSKLLGIKVATTKSTREIDFQQIPYEKRVERVLSYL